MKHEKKKRNKKPNCNGSWIKTNSLGENGSLTNGNQWQRIQFYCLK